LRRLKRGWAEDMDRETTSHKGRYLYAITAGDQERDYGPCGIGDGLVYAIPGGEISAVVSDVPDQKMRPERRHLAAHQRVLKSLMEETTPLPMSFGIIADGQEAIQRILLSNREALVRELRRVRNKVEMGLRVAWEVPNIFEYFVNTHPDLRSARDTYFGTHREPTQEERIELGRMFDRTLNEDREMHTEAVEETLSLSCSEIKRSKCRTEREIMNLACLVGRDSQAQFEKGVFDAAKLFDNNFTFDYNGPWAPHNFVDMELEM
jgi:hypothetical protein